MKKELLRSLPKTDELLRNKNLEEYGKNNIGNNIVVKAIQIL